MNRERGVYQVGGNNALNLPKDGWSAVNKSGHCIFSRRDWRHEAWG